VVKSHHHIQYGSRNPLSGPGEGGKILVTNNTSWLKSPSGNTFGENTIVILYSGFSNVIPQWVVRFIPMGNWNFEFLFGNLILMTANVAVVVEGIYWIWSLPTFVSSSFLCNLVCQKAGIRNNTYICLKKSWSSPNWDEIGKYKSNKKLWYFISIFTQLHRLQNPCSVHPKTPPHPFLYLNLYLNFTTGGTREKAACRSILVSHVTKLLSETRSGPVCVCVLWIGLRVCVISVLSCLTYTHKMLSMLSHFQTKHISFSKHETQIMFWFYGQKSLIV